MANNLKQKRSCHWHSYAESCEVTHSFRFKIGEPPKAPIELGSTDILRLTFSIHEKSVEGNGAGVQPHQTFLRFVDEESGEEGIQPVRVLTNGKAKFELVSIKNIAMIMFLNFS